MPDGQKTRRAVPIFGVGGKARSPFLSSVRRVNAVSEAIPNGRQERAVIGLPGLDLLTHFSDIPARSIFQVPGEHAAYVATGAELLYVSPAGYEKVADLALDSGPVWMDNNGVELFVNDGVSPFVYRFATQTVIPITDVDYPYGARGGVYLAGRFWVIATRSDKAGRIYASDIRNGIAWDGLNFIEPSSKPDSVLAIARHADDLVIMGNASIEWWSASPSAIPGALGFQPSASANTEVGLVSERSYASVGQQFLFLGQLDGETNVYRVNGYTVESVGLPEVRDGLLSYESAVCTSYGIMNKSLFQVTVQHDDPARAITLVYDTEFGEWSERVSHGKPYYRGLYASGSGSRVFMTDAFSGMLYAMDDTRYDEAGDPLEFIVTSSHLLNEGDHITLHGVQIDMEPGLGHPAPPGDDPHGMIRVSKDGGETWPIERHVSLGKAGSHRHRVKADRFGVARDFAIEFSTTAPIPRRVTGAYLTMEQGYA